MDYDDDWYRSKHYFGLSDAARDVKQSYGAKETAVNSAKFAGKTIFNAALFGGLAAVKVLKEAPDLMKQAAERQQNRKR